MQVSWVDSQIETTYLSRNAVNTLLWNDSTSYSLLMGVVRRVVEHETIWCLGPLYCQDSSAKHRCGSGSAEAESLGTLLAGEAIVNTVKS